MLEILRLREHRFLEFHSIEHILREFLRVTRIRLPCSYFTIHDEDKLIEDFLVVEVEQSEQLLNRLSCDSMEMWENSEFIALSSELGYQEYERCLHCK